MHLRYTLGAAIFLLLTSAAQADPIPSETLAEEHRSCIAACTQRGFALANCKPYCDCFAESFGQQFTLEEYTAVIAASKQNQAPPQDVIDRMASITKACGAGIQ
jgi:hypothetical protein